MTQVKGTALGSTVRFARERFGDDGYGLILTRLASEDRGALEKGIIVSAWYPFGLMLRLMRETEACFGAQTTQVFRQMGRASADYSLTTIYRIFVRLGSPQFTLAKAARV